MSASDMRVNVFDVVPGIAALSRAAPATLSNEPNTKGAPQGAPYQKRTYEPSPA